MNLSLKINEPSGEMRTISLHGTVTLGRNRDSQIQLKDPTISPNAGVLSLSDLRLKGESPMYWLKIPREAPPARLGDLQVRETHLPLGATFRIGETSLQLVHSRTEPLSTTALPPGIKPWLTCSESGRKLLQSARKAAATPLSLYLAGETGTGKEVMANLLHAWSPRKTGPFIPLHCGALALSLIESELFGHTKGAFTGALQQRPGALLQAHGGTLFLDEIGDLPLDVQVKILRFLENGEIRPVGADHTTRADVRLICATHQPLLKLVAEGKFRRDLYYRLASVTLEIPTLRSRPDDIEMLAEQFASRLHRTLSTQATLRLKTHPWPGNVRELQHAIERAVGLSSPFEPLINEEAFDFLLTQDTLPSAPELHLGVLTFHEMERVLLLKTLKLAKGNRGRAAEIMGVARSTIFEMLKRHKIPGPRAKFASDGVVEQSELS